MLVNINLKIHNQNSNLMEKIELEKARIEIKFLRNQTSNLERELENYKSVKDLTITAYSPTKNQTDSDPFITACMERVRAGGVAVSQDLFYKGWTCGKRVFIRGKGIFRINDVMNRRKKNQIDVFYFNTKQALRNGIKKAKVALLVG